MELASLVMERKMLRGIKQRAERPAAAYAPASSRELRSTSTGTPFAGGAASA